MELKTLLVLNILIPSLLKSNKTLKKQSTLSVGILAGEPQ